MKKNNSSTSKLDIAEPISERKIKKVNLEITKLEGCGPPKMNYKKHMIKSLRELQERKHKKTLSNIDILSLPFTNRQKEKHSSTKNSKINLEVKELSKPSLFIPNLVHAPVFNSSVASEEEKINQLSKKFLDFKENIKKITRKTKVYKKSSVRANNFIYKQRQKMFSKQLVLKIIFLAWKKVAKSRKKVKNIEI